MISPMRGVVKYMNQQQSMIAVEIDTRCFSIIELLGDEGVELGDCLEWDGYALGPKRCFNRTQNNWFEPYFQNHDVRPDQLRRQLLMD